MLRIVLAMAVSGLLVGLAVRGSSSASQGGGRSPVRSGRFVTAASDAAVVTETAAWQVPRLGCGAPPLGLYGYWVPAPADLASIEAVLPAWLEVSVPGRDLPTNGRDIRVSRQYIGMYKARRCVILINAWQADPRFGRVPARDRLHFSCGGGSLYFRVVFDVATHAFTGFQGNGGI